MLDAVNQSQLDLRRHVKQLIEENRCLQSEDEREYFHFIFPYCTLGLAVNTPIIKFLHHSYNEKGEKVSGFLALETHLEAFARWLADRSDNLVRFTDTGIYYGKGTEETVYYDMEIKNLWNMLLNGLYRVFPIAIQRATSMSKGIEEKTGDKGYSIDG